MAALETCWTWPYEGGRIAMASMHGGIFGGCVGGLKGSLSVGGKAGWWSSHGGGFAAGTGFVCALAAVLLEGKGGEVKGDGLGASWSNLEDSCSCSTGA
jgi:hypothetical protein